MSSTYSSDFNDFPGLAAYIDVKRVVPRPRVSREATAGYPTLSVTRNVRCVLGNRYKQYFLPVGRKGAIAFLASRRFNDGGNHVLSFTATDKMVDTLWEDKDWRLQVFVRSAVAKYNIVCFFYN